jgi:dienelactone hydrolase
MMWTLSLLLACGSHDAAPETEPLDLPAAPEARGVPVGVRTFVDDGYTFEVWYPAPAALAGQATDLADFAQFVPPAFLERVGAFAFPDVDGRAVRDAPLRVTGERLPVVVFSHGFGGVRLQSLDYVTHLASRGYVVIATDHGGRSMPDLLPCVFSPPLEGCDLRGFGGEDPGVDGVRAALDWLEDADAGEVASATFLADALDLGRVGLTGHSAGGGTTAEAGTLDARFGALLPMAAPAASARDVPQALVSGTCDAIVTDASIAEAALDAEIPLVRVGGAGHLAFSDLCSLELAELAEGLLAPRDDLNPALYRSLLQLATDGCPGFAPDPALACGEAFLPIEDGWSATRHVATTFFDFELRGVGPGLQAGSHGAAEVLPTP